MSTIERSEVVERINDVRDELRDDISEVKGLVIDLSQSMNRRVTAVERKQIADVAARKAVEQERERISKQNQQQADHAHRIKDSIETLAVVAAVPATIFAALIASGRIF